MFIKCPISMKNHNRITINIINSTNFDYMQKPSPTQLNFNSQSQSINNNLNAQQLRELKRAFDQMDQDQNGYLDPDAIEKLIQGVLGVRVNQEAKLEMIAEVNENWNGGIQYQEFQQLFKRKFIRSNFEKEMELAFNLIDSSNKSYITYQQLQRICNQLDMDFTPEEIKLMIEKGSSEEPGSENKQQPGKVYLNQFIQMMRDN